MSIKQDRTVLEFDTKEDGIDFIPDIMTVLDKIPELAQLQDVIRQMHIGDELKKIYTFDSDTGEQKVEFEIDLHDDTLCIYVNSSNEIVGAIDDRWWDKYPDE